jgi:hypothetical protein
MTRSGIVVLPEKSADDKAMLAMRAGLAFGPCCEFALLGGGHMTSLLAAAARK